MREPSGEVVSAIGKSLGSQEQPTSIGDGYTIFPDNVLVELNIPPSKGLLQFIARLQKGLKLAALEIAPYKLDVIASLEFPQDQLDDLRAFVFGCSPEYSAYDFDTAGLPKRIAGPVIRPGNGFRSCGGHIHIGHESALNNPVQLVQSLDFFVGVTSLLLDHDPTSHARREIYGGAGNFRPTKYGLEYRTLSNFWLRDPALAAVIHKLVSFAIDYHDKNSFDSTYMRVINSGQTSTAWTVWNEDIYPVLWDAGEFSLIQIIREMMSKHQRPSFYEAWGINKALDRLATPA